MPVEFHGLAVLQQLAETHQRDSIGHGHRFDLVVGDVQHRGAELLGKFTDLAADFFSETRVEIAERLVHQQHPRIDRDGTSQCHPLLLPATQERGRSIRLLVKLHHAECFSYPAVDFTAGNFLRALASGSATF